MEGGREPVRRFAVDVLAPSSCFSFGLCFLRGALSVLAYRIVSRCFGVSVSCGFYGGGMILFSLILVVSDSCVFFSRFWGGKRTDCCDVIHTYVSPDDEEKKSVHVRSALCDC